jgi:hypothetical protein
MDSTSEPIDKANGTEDKSVAKVKRVWGMSAWACAYKARNWTLESSKDPSTHNANAKETYEPQPITRTTDA